MRSIKASFLEVKEDNPFWSDFICLSTAIGGRNFSKDRIRIAFSKLVDKNDYFNSRNKLLNHLVNLSQNPTRHHYKFRNLKPVAFKIQS